MKKGILFFAALLIAGSLYVSQRFLHNTVRATAPTPQPVYNSASAQSIQCDSVPQPAKDYTLLIYMIGSDLESTLGNATRDMEEIRTSGVDFSRCNIIGYTGGCRRWLGRIPSQQNNVVDLSMPLGQQVVASTQEVADMGKPETLTTFLDFAVEHYPADHYALIFWDHGGGPLWGYGADTLFGGDGLSLGELSAALNSSPFSSKKLDWIGFDACLMGSLECMATLTPFAQYAVASEDLEPGTGWDYGFLKILNDTYSPEPICTAAVNAYVSYYESMQSPSYHPNLSLAAFDLSKLSTLTQLLDSFSTALNEWTHSGNYVSMQQLRSRTSAFGQTVRSDFSYDLVDLECLLAPFKDQFPQSLQVIQALHDCRIAFGTNINEIGGLSVYYPFSNKEQYNQQAQQYYTASPLKGYSRFLKSNALHWLQTGKAPWTLAIPELHEKRYCLTLSPEQQLQVTDAFYSVFLKKEDTYCCVLTHASVERTEENSLSIPADPAVICQVMPGQSPFLWNAVQISPGSYLAKDVSFCSSAGSILQVSDLENADLIATLASSADNTSLRLCTVNYLESDSVLAGKSTLNPSQYDGITFYSGGKTVEYDSYGNTLPYSEWTSKASYINIQTARLDHSFQFEMIPCSTIPEQWALQIVVLDDNGNAYATPVFDLPCVSKNNTVEVTIDCLTAMYELHESYAILKKAIQACGSITVPQYIHGKPVVSIAENAFRDCLQLSAVQLPATVTEICAQAFRGCYALKEVSLPDSLQILGSDAFCQCQSLKSIDLPASLTFLGDGFAEGCHALESVSIAGCSVGQLPGILLRNGVLFSDDGKTLLLFPAAKEGSYVVPDGTEKIASCAFLNSQLQEITLPESLKTIGNYAFYNAENLHCPRFPAKLVQIGHHAFGGDSLTVHRKGPQADVSIHLGANVSFLGKGAFDLYTNRRFTVDEENAYFCTLDGHLCTDGGTQLLIPALNGSDTITIPQGISCLNWDVFSFQGTMDLWNYLWILELPDSICYVEGNFSKCGNIQIRAPTGSFAHSYAIQNGISTEEQAYAGSGNTGE